MNELSGLELRKALIEALGWKLFNYESGMYATTPEDIADALTNDGYTLEGWSESREAWEFQPESDTAVFWPAFEQWCRANDHEPSQTSYEADGAKDWFIFTISVAVQPRQWFTTREHSTTSILEAGCRAWLKALESIGKESE
jgi:hypothetical protein